MKYDMNAMMNMVDTLSAEARKECTAKVQGFAALYESVDEINEKTQKSPIITKIMKDHVNPFFVENPTADQIDAAINTGYIVKSIIDGVLGHCFADQEITNAYIPFNRIISESYIAQQNSSVFMNIARNEKDEIAESYFSSLTNDIGSLIKQFTLDFTTEDMIPSDFESYVNGLIDNVNIREYAMADENQTEDQHHMFVRNQAYDEYINLCIIATAINTAANTILVNNQEPAQDNVEEPEMMTPTNEVSDEQAPINVSSQVEIAPDGGVPAGEGGEPAPDNAIEILE